MGAPAISALAGNEVLGALGSSTGLRLLVDAQLACAWALLPALVLGEVRHALLPVAARTATGSRWATVFPLGMLSVSSRSLAHGPALTAGADISLTVALMAWLLAVLTAGYPPG